MFYNIFKIVAVSTLISSLALVGCGGGGKTDQASKQTSHEGMSSGEMMPSHGEESTTHQMEGTMDKVFTAEKLYTCPMHPEVVTADAEQNCPLCHMKLTALTDEKVTKLKSSHPKGCPMDLIVVKDDSEIDTCPVCNMKLKVIEQHDHEGDM